MSKPKIQDNRGGHVRLYWDMLDSMAWRALSWVEQGLYIAMRRKLKGTNNGNIEATLATLRHAEITSPSTLSKSLKSLQAVGLIAKTRQGGIAYGTKVCSLYRFTDEQVYEQPKVGVADIKATNDWKKFKTLNEARLAIKQSQAQIAKAKGKNAE
ncbi:hypothetical protein [Aquabacterium sp.]|uniref:hypothetical protein n=1 Tax=Aquabacterium sp. TaxID=1872578 RepID=UPI0035B321C8